MVESIIFEVTKYVVLISWAALYIITIFQAKKMKQRAWFWILITSFIIGYALLPMIATYFIPIIYILTTRKQGVSYVRTQTKE